MSTTHLTYAPPAAWSVPVTSQLWYPGVPAANYTETTDANATAYIAHGLYTGVVGTAPVQQPAEPEHEEAV